MKASDKVTEELLQAAERGRHAEVARILKANRSADVNASKLVDGKTALIVAAQNGQLGVVRELLSRHDVDVNAVDQRGMTALHHAVTADDEDVVKEILKHDESDVNKRQLTRQGLTPLHMTAKKGNLETLK